MNTIKLVASAAVVYLLCHPSHAATKREDSQYWVDHVDCEQYPAPDMCKMVRSATQFLLAEPESEPIDARVRVCANKIGGSIGLAGVTYNVLPPAKNGLAGCGKMIFDNGPRHIDSCLTAGRQH